MCVKQTTCLQNMILLIITLIITLLSVVLLFERSLIHSMFNISLRLLLFTKTS
jgi:hypothetical protein